MSKGNETPDYEIGYGKPPKSGQFKKGVSGNPSGRPKKPSDFLSVLLREVNVDVPVQENGKRKKVKKLELAVKQLVNKSASGSVQNLHLLFKYLPYAYERAAGMDQNPQSKRDIESMNPEELTDAQLAWIIKKALDEAAKNESVSEKGNTDSRLEKH